MIERGGELHLVEIKAGQTPHAKYFSAFSRLAERMEAKGDAAPWRLGERVVVYGGDETQDRSRGRLLAWTDLDQHDWTGSLSPDPGLQTG